MSGTRVLRALALASLATLVFHTHVYLEFRPVRVKLVQSPLQAAGGAVRVGTAGFPRVRELSPPFALIARVNVAAGGTSRLSVAIDGVPVCGRDVVSGASRRLDCAVALPWDGSTDHELVIRGPDTGWTLDFLEIATHHGNTSGSQTLYILPRDSANFVAPGAWWSAALWAAVAAILLLLAPHPMARRARLAYRIVAGLLIGLLAVIAASERISNYRVVLAAGTFLPWLAMLVSPRLWSGGRHLTLAARRAANRVRVRAAARLAPVFDRHPAWRPTREWARVAWQFVAPALVVGLFCVPLFVNLGEPEMRSDEAIYAYAVERILDTGEWLTPRSISDDTAFLEKPPLKFWLVAALMRAGLLPTDERGMRWLDALFGSVAFLYVYALGRRLSGPLCGVVAVLVLFTLDPLVFEHGLRSHNMEAALFLCYCGGIFHAVQWADAGERRAQGHAAAVAAYFFLGFMTKFVAAFFLPVVLVVALALRRDGWMRVRAGWRDWVVPVLVAAGLAAPWFVYESVREPARFWQTIFGAHVFERFTSSLDTAHLHPWHYYFVQTWKELRLAGTHWVVLAGIAALLLASLRRKSWLAGLFLIWGILPVAAMSLGTSKLLHYAYPFWPVLGLAAGLIVAQAARAVDGPPGTAVAAWLSRLVPRWVVAWWVGDARRRGVLVVVAAAAVATAAWTAAWGPFQIRVRGATWFSNGTVLAPLMVAGGLLVMGGYARTTVRLAVTAGLLALVPVGVYNEKLAHVRRTDHPIRAVRDCIVSVKRTGVRTGSGVLGVHRDIQHWSYYYYLWRVGAWAVHPEFSPERTEERLWTPGEQTPVIISRADYETIVRRAGLWEATFPEAVVEAAAPPDPVAAAARNPLQSGARFDDHVAVLLPGPFQACLADVLDAGAQPLWKTPLTTDRR